MLDISGDEVENCTDGDGSSPACFMESGLKARTYVDGEGFKVRTLKSTSN